MNREFNLSFPTRLTGQTHNLTLYDIIDYNYDLGLGDYPIWDENKRVWLNDQIINHFLFREIACETPAQFIFYLNRRMNEHMHEMNPLFDLLEDVTGEDLRRTGKYSNDSEGKGTGSTASDSHSYVSTNPRQTMVGKDPTTYYDSGTYTTSTGSSTSASSGNENGVSYNGFITDATNAWYTGINNALTLVFDMLEPCFSHIWKDHFNCW